MEGVRGEGQTGGTRCFTWGCTSRLLGGQVSPCRLTAREKAASSCMALMRGRGCCTREGEGRPRRQGGHTEYLFAGSTLAVSTLAG